MLEDWLMPKTSITKRRAKEIADRDARCQCVGVECSEEKNNDVVPVRRLGLCLHCYRQESKDWVGKKTRLEREVVIAKKAADGRLIASRQGQWLPRERQRRARVA